jgi:hypothetical protein
MTETFNLQSLVDIGEHLDIRDQKEGWLRLGVKLTIKNVSLDLPESMKSQNITWDKILEALPGVKSVKLKPMLMALDIEYDPAEAPASCWQSWVNVEASDELLAFFQQAIDQLQ